MYGVMLDALLRIACTEGALAGCEMNNTTRSKDNYPIFKQHLPSTFDFYHAVPMWYQRSLDQA
jgi:hypothetical protein